MPPKSCQTCTYACTLKRTWKDLPSLLSSCGGLGQNIGIEISHLVRTATWTLMEVRRCLSFRDLVGFPSGAWYVWKCTARLNDRALGTHRDPGSAAGKLIYNVWLLTEALALKRQALLNKKGGWLVRLNPSTQSPWLARGKAYTGGLMEVRQVPGSLLDRGWMAHATPHSRPRPCRTPPEICWAQCEANH